MKSLTQFISLLFVLSACSNHSYKVGEKGQFVFASKVAAVDAFESSVLTCQDLKNCPDYVGSLTIYEELVDRYEIAACSMTLIGADTILTNRHCVPRALQFKGAKCAENIKINFAKNSNHAEEKFDCLEVVDVSSDYGDITIDEKPDWAILRINGETQRTAATKSLSGIANHSKLNLYSTYTDIVDKVTFFQPVAEIRPHVCYSQFATFKTNFYFHTLSALVSIAECNDFIKHGNSGTGLFDTENNLVGVLSAMIGLPDNAARGNKEGVGVNLACIPYFNSTPSEFCYFDLSEEFLAQVNLIKTYVLLNQDRYFQTLDLEVKERSLWIRPGGGMTVDNYVDLDSKTRAAYPFIFSNPGVEAYLLENTLGFAFQDTGSCVEQDAPAEFEAKLPMHFSKEANDKHFERRMVIRETFADFRFKKIEQGYEFELVITENESKINYAGKLPTCR